MFHVQTECASGPCDWGLQWACIGDDPLEVTYSNLAFKETTLLFYPLDGDQLRVTAWDRFRNPPVTIQAQKTDYTFR